MTSFVEFGVPVLIFAGYFLLVRVVLRQFGFGLLNWRMSPERVAPWRRLKSWQFVMLRGYVCWAVPMFLFIFALGAASAYGEQTLGKDFPLHYIRPRHYVADFVYLGILIAGGASIGMSSWQAIWNHKYDTVSGSPGTG